MSNPGLSLLEGKYMVTMDLYPQQSPVFTQMHPFYEHLREGRLTTTRSRQCGAEPFPPRILCPACRSTDMEWVDWPTSGKVLELTEEVVGIPHGFGTPPLVHVLVDLPEKKPCSPGSSIAGKASFRSAMK
ncbi:MAG: zinc ribbon domain-containing protein [Thermodesulfobacteriota bacterium]